MNKIPRIWRKPCLSGPTRRLRKRPLESCYFAVKPLSDSIVLITTVCKIQLKYLNIIERQMSLKRCFQHRFLGHSKVHFSIFSIKKKTVSYLPSWKVNNLWMNLPLKRDLNEEETTSQFREMTREFFHKSIYDWLL